MNGKAGYAIIGAVMTLIVQAVGVGVWVGNNSSRLGAAEATIEKIQEVQVDRTERLTGMETQLARIEERLIAVQQVLASRRATPEPR